MALSAQYRLNPLAWPCPVNIILIFNIASFSQYTLDMALSSQHDLIYVHGHVQDVGGEEQGGRGDKPAD